jgi:DNA-binding NtrC family response regulator
VNPPPAPRILLVERDIIVRSPLAEYLRGCGYRVLEAVNAAEARELLDAADDITLVLADGDAPEGGGFILQAWIRENYPGIEVILAGSIKRVVEKAGDICKDGPAVSKPYHHQAVLDTIRRLLAARDRNKPGTSGYQAHSTM